MNAEEKMAKIYRAAMREIKDFLFGIDPATITPARIARIRAEVKTTVRALDYAAASWTNKEIPRAYMDSARTSRVALEILGRAQMKRGKKSPISVVAAKTLDFYLEANRSIIKTVDRYLSIVQMAKRTIQTAAIQEFNFTEPEEAEWLRDRARYAVEAEQAKGTLKRDVKEHLQDLVVDGKLIEINGKNWAMDKYADLVARTSLRDAATDATRNLCEQFENDLIEVSSHATDCEICTEFEGNVYSLSGTNPKYPSIDEFPPYHPNCKHSILPTSDEAIEARAWEKKQLEAPAPPPPPPPSARPAAALREIPARPVPVRPSEWRAAATKAEAEQWARANFAAIADYSKVSLDVANILNKNLSLLAAKGIRLDGIGPSSIVKREFATKKGRNFVMAVYHREEMGRVGVGAKKIMIAYNPNAMGTVEKMNRTMTQLSNANLLKGVTQDGLVQHEIGHVIDFLNSSGWNRASGTLINQWNALFTHLTDRALAEQVIRAETGSYVFSNTVEFYAECFRLYKMDKLPPRLSFVKTYFLNLGW